MIDLTDVIIHLLLVAFSIVLPASIAFFGVVAYILVRGRLRKGKPHDETPSQRPAESGQ